jgi:hypothetical protein
VPMKHGLPLRTPGRVSMTVVRSVGLHGTHTRRAEHASPGGVTLV